jgi:hypothetical protein
MLSDITEIACVGKDGVLRRFDVTAQDIGKWETQLACRPADSAPDSECFELVLKDLGKHYQVKMINAHKVYGGQGVPDSLLPAARHAGEKPICSSPSRGAPGSDDWRTDDATKMWKRLVSKGLATYEPKEDTFWIR